MSSFEMLDRLTKVPEKERIVISRYWDHPEITVTINRDKITVEATLLDFLKALSEELEPSPDQRRGWLAAKLLPEEPSRKQRTTHEILLAANKALEKIKEATCQVM